MTTVLRTDTAAIPIAAPDTTVELLVPWLLPPVTATYTRPPSPVIAHLRDSARHAFWPAVVGSGLIVGLYLVVLTRGLAWDRTDWLLAGCSTVAALSALALIQLRNPRSFLSRLVDGPAGENTDRKALR